MRISEDRAQSLLDAVPDGEPFDLVQTLTQPLPVIVIAELLGVPPRIARCSGAGRQRGRDDDEPVPDARCDGVERARPLASSSTTSRASSRTAGASRART